MAQRPSFFGEFLPSGHRPISNPPKQPPAPTNVDREASPAVQRHRVLNQYGINILNGIQKDYDRGVSDWKIAFGDILAALSSAIGKRDAVLEAEKLAREKEAAVTAFIMSLLTAGSMRFLGAYVQYSFFPSFLSKSHVMVTMKNGAPAWTLVTQEFSKLQASAFGGIAQDIGNRAVALTFPSPRKPNYQLERATDVELLRADFNRLLEAGASLVSQQLSDAQEWMNESTEFGAAWAAQHAENQEKARFSIRTHFEKLRKQWAEKWVFYGREPAQISKLALAEEIERSLWAAYVARALESARTYEPMFEDASQGNLVDEVIVNRLKELNVVVAETNKGKLDQANRMIAGAPRPDTRVVGDVNYDDEVIAMKKWSEGLLTNLGNQPATKYFPAAKDRALTPIGSYVRSD